MRRKFLEFFIPIFFEFSGSEIFQTFWFVNPSIFFDPKFSNLLLRKYHFLFFFHFARFFDQGNKKNFRKNLSIKKAGKLFEPENSRKLRKQSETGQPLPEGLKKFQPRFQKIFFSKIKKSVHTRKFGKKSNQKVQKTWSKKFKNELE